MVRKNKIIANALAASALASTPAAAETFNGPYAGVNAGWSRAEIDTNIDGAVQVDEETTRDSASLGVHAGYNHRAADRIVIGAEGGFSINADDRLNGLSGGAALEVDPRYSFDLAARAGYLISDKALVFARGGYANERIRTSVATDTDTLRNSTNVDGWSVGGGVEYALTDHISARAEYRYSDIGNNGGDYDRHQALVGLSYNF